MVMGEYRDEEESRESEEDDEGCNGRGRGKEERRVFCWSSW